MHSDDPWKDELAVELRRAARRSEPEFSEALHTRIVAVRELVLPDGRARYRRFAACAVALSAAACLMLTVQWIEHTPKAAPAVADRAPADERATVSAELPGVAPRVGASEEDNGAALLDQLLGLTFNLARHNPLQRIGTVSPPARAPRTIRVAPAPEWIAPAENHVAVVFDDRDVRLWLGQFLHGGG